MVEYTHQELNKETPTPSGYYVTAKEVRVPYGGREVLYTVSGAVVESSCCGTGDFCTAIVPGFVKRWRAGQSAAGRPVTEVEPISDEAVREAVRRLIRSREHVCLTEFW